MALKFAEQNGEIGWWTCGCGGKPKVMEVAKSESEIMFLNVPAFGQTFTGVSGAKYRATPSQVALDVTSEDAQSFVSGNLARFATNEDRARYQGSKIRFS